MKKLLIVILFFSNSNARSNKEGLKLKIGNRVAIIPYGNELVIHHNHDEQLIQGELFNVSNNKIFLNNIETNNRFIVLKDSIKAIKTKATTSNLKNFKTGFAIGSVIGFGVGAATTLYSYLEYKELIGIVYGAMIFTPITMTLCGLTGGSFNMIKVNEEIKNTTIFLINDNNWKILPPKPKKNWERRSKKFLNKLPYTLPLLIYWSTMI